MWGRPRFHREDAEEADVVRRLGQDVRLALKACGILGWLLGVELVRAGVGTPIGGKGQSCARYADCPSSMILSAPGSASRGNSHCRHEPILQAPLPSSAPHIAPITVHSRDTDVLESIGTALAGRTKRIVSWR